VPLAQGFALVPVAEGLLRSLNRHAFRQEATTRDGFERLTEPVYELGLRLSAEGIIAYVEAEYFGGIGGQDAVVWEQGRLAMEPLHALLGRERLPGTVPGSGRAVQPINEALRRLGVKRGDSDEFDALGLWRYRKTERWLTGS
jgi:hypothetical protein